MGELLYCNESIATVPYYIEGIAWNIYSLEELCYYIEHNTYLLDREFMSEELLQWIGTELKNDKLEDKLREILRMRGGLSEFVFAILIETGYCERETIRQIVNILRGMEQKSDFERSKMRADRLMEHQKYLSSIYEYKRLLEGKEAFKQEKWLIGNVWHNLGTAYARLFLFKEAATCYETAYKWNKNEESIKECLATYLCLDDEDSFMRVIQIYQISEMKVLEVKNAMLQSMQSRNMQMLEEYLQQMSEMNQTGYKKEYRNAVSNLMFNWKEEYRKIVAI